MSLVIDIVGQFSGKKAFDQAESAAEKLGRTVKTALIGVGVTAFAKSAISAFAAQEKQLNLFKNSLRTIGFEFATSDSLAFLNSLKLQYGVVDEQLIPAYQQLLTTTRSLAASQNLTNVALDIAARQNISVTAAADALSKAYLGNTKSVGALGLGISKATLASGDFSAILKEITNITKGSAASAADTFSGKLAKIKVAADSAKVSIGAGLVEALMQISQSTDIDQLQGKIINFGNSAAETLANVGKLISENIVLIKSFAIVLAAAFTVNKIAAFIASLQTIIKVVKQLRNALIASAVARNFLFNPLGAAVATGAMFAAIGLVTKGVEALSDSTTRATENLLNLFGASKALGVGGDQGGAAKYAEGAAARAAADAKAAAAAQLKATQAQTKALKDQAKLKKAQTLFDLDQIQILAALQGQVTEDEKLRLSLQLALIQGNASEAERLAAQLAISQLQTTNLALAIAKLPAALNPFRDYPVDVLEAINDINGIQKALDGLKAPKLSVIVDTIYTSSTLGGVGAGGGGAGGGGLGIGATGGITELLGPSGDQGAAARALEQRRNDLTNLERSLGRGGDQGGPNRVVNVTVQGSVISNKDLADTIRMQLVDSSASGSFSSIGRVRDYQ
jgi:hypothetical protein